MDYQIKVGVNMNYELFVKNCIGRIPISISKFRVENKTEIWNKKGSWIYYKNSVKLSNKILSKEMQAEWVMITLLAIKIIYT